MRRFCSPARNFANDEVVLDVDDTRHLRDVLRLKAGDEVNVFDGEGREFSCRIASVEKRQTHLKVLREVSPAAPESPLRLTLAAAITKGEKFDIVVQKAVELGVDTLSPLYTQRCEVKPNGSDRRLERWRKIAQEAAKQCGRARHMTVNDPIDFREFALQSTGQVLMFSERDGDEFKKFSAAEGMTAVIGPAGGWDDSELTLARERGFFVATLGGRILRAETAAIAFMAILQHRFGDIN
jgi:16S rRNA (uracil1498-N3)-methyltransferase